MLDIKDCCCIQEMDIEKAKEEIRQKEIQIKEMQERLKKEFGIDVTKTEEDDGISQYIKETKRKLKRQEEINKSNCFRYISYFNLAFAIILSVVLIFAILAVIVQIIF